MCNGRLTNAFVSGRNQPRAAGNALRVPGIGLTGTERIVSARRVAAVDLTPDEMGISLNGAVFITATKRCCRD
jgi:predicted DNA-binding helix-hairpin-helix protein